MKSPVENLWERLARRHGRRRSGLTLGESLDESIAMDFEQRMQHLYVIGKSGYGKTSLLRHLILQDLEAGNGLALLAPDQQAFTEEILPYIPQRRIKDVVYIDPRDIERPIAFNPLHLQLGEDLDRKVEETITVFERMVAEDASGAAPRLKRILENTLYALIQVPGSTLLDIPRLLSRPTSPLRERVIKQLPEHDETTRTFWANEYAKLDHTAHQSLLNRIERLSRSRIIRAFLCQPARCFDVAAAMNAGKILLFNLSAGLGPQTSRLIGQFVIAKLQLATEHPSRADIPERMRRPFYVYIDEFQKFCGTSHESYDEMFSRGRKYRVPITLAHPHTGHVPEPVLRTILGTVSTLVVFRVGSTDAVRLGKNLGLDRNSVSTLCALPRFTAYCRLGSDTFQIQTPRPLTGGRPQTGRAVIRHSRLKYGVPPEPLAASATPVQSSAVSELPRLEDLKPEEVFGG